MERKALLGVIERAVVLPRRLADATAPRKTAAAIVAPLAALIQRRNAQAARALLRLGDLPFDILREIIVGYPDIAQTVGIRIEIPIAGRQFERAAFFRAAQTAFADGASEVGDVNGVLCQLVGRPSGDGQRAAIEIHAEGVERVDEDPRLGLADRQSNLDDVVRNCTRGDTGPAARGPIVAQLEAQPDVAERARLLDEFIRDGLVAHYTALLSAFRDQRAVTADMLMPGVVSRMSGWLRIDRADAVDFDAAATLLMSETDLFTALDRNMALPRPMPTVLTTALVELPFLERRRLLKRLYRQAQTGIDVAHLIVLASLSYETGALRQRIVHVLWDRLTQVCAERAFLQLDILRWVINELSRSEATRAWSTEALLAIAWSHANETMRLLLGNRIDPRAIATSLNARLYPYEERLLGRRDVREDVAHPGNVQPETYTMACADMVVRAGLQIDQQSRAGILGLLLTRGENGRPNGFAASLLWRNDELPDSMGSIFAWSWVDQGDDLFADILNTTIREWRDDVPEADPFPWLRFSAAHGDCESMNAADRELLFAAAENLDQAPVDWASVEERTRFGMVMFRFHLLTDDVRRRLRVLWESEVRRVSALADSEVRREAVDILFKTTVDLCDDADPNRKIEQFAALLGLLRRTLRTGTFALDNVITMLHARLAPASARHFDPLIVAVRLR
jgi:hypothetical protein